MGLLLPGMEASLGCALGRLARFESCAGPPAASSSSLSSDGKRFGAGVAHLLLRPLKVQNLKLPTKVPSEPGTCCQGFSLHPNTMQSTVPAIVKENVESNARIGIGCAAYLSL